MANGIGIRVNAFLASHPALTGGVVGLWAAVFALAALAYSVFLFVTASIAPLPSLHQRMLFVAGTLALVFLAFPTGPLRDGRPRIGIVDLALVALSIVVGWFSFSQIDTLALAGGDYARINYYAGVTLLLLILEATRRTIGWGLIVLSLVFVAYAIWGGSLPGILRHFGFSVERVVMHLYMTTEGVLGITTGIAATYVFLFVLFGAFLARTGVSEFFNDMSIAVAGRRVGGPAKVGVLASAVMGTINGSAASNVATTGNFTIPMMRQIGYRPSFAGAVESAASTGGQIMPPVMGAGAFIMAETLGVPYREVMIAAIIPALLYFCGIWFAVDLRARHRNLARMDEALIPDPLASLKRDGHLALPLLLVIYLLVAGYSPLYAASIAIIATIPVSWIRWHRGMRPMAVLEAMVMGARDSLQVGVACIVVGFIVGVVSLTGLGTRLGYSVISIAQDSMILTLGLTMIVCLILGMGLPTSAAYIVAAVIAVPILGGLDVLPIAAHFFVFYFAILAGITPPVAITSFIAAGIARAPAGETSWLAIRIALPGFIIPYMFIYDPVLLLRDGGALDQLWAFATALLGLYLLTAAFEGWLAGRMKWLERLVSAVLSMLLIVPETRTDLIAIAGLGAFGLWLWFRRRKVKIGAGAEA